MSDPDIPPPPEGFVLAKRGPFSTHNGPFFVRPEEGGGLTHAFHVLPRHCNRMGIVHGGMLATFFDGVLGHATSLASGARAVTIHLGLDYLAAARQGEWVFGEGRATRTTKDLVFVEGRLYTETRDVLRGSAIFKLRRSREAPQT